jgi:hypothetical protein
MTEHIYSPIELTLKKETLYSLAESGLILEPDWTLEQRRKILFAQIFVTF